MSLAFNSWSILLFGCVTRALLSPPQYHELIRFYNATNGDQWTWAMPSQKWNLTTDPCVNTWTGIECNNSLVICEVEVCGIQSINLQGLGLRNNLPTTFGILSDLSSLILRDNQLLGPLPSVLGELSHLHTLSLGLNNFSSSIPSEFGFLRLELLDLSSNQLIGTLPSEFNNTLFTSTITHLYLGENRLQGSFPTMIPLMTNLRLLSLAYNAFTGTLPSAICSLRSLHSFGIASNYFHGSLPNCLNDNFSALEHFHLSNNSLHGPLPSFRSSSNLTYFRANGNQFTGTIPSEYGNFSKFEVLELGRNHLIGTIPSGVGQLTSLYTLYLHDNSLTGTLPQFIGHGGAMELEFLILFNNKFTGTVPSSFGSLVKLQELVLHTNKLTGPLPSSLVQLTNLRIFLIQNNEFTGFTRPVVPPISLSDTGAPPAPFLSPTLEHLDISNNRFNGPLSGIPFTSLPGLRTLAAVENCFSGTLPSEICSPKGLEVCPSSTHRPSPLSICLCRFLLLTA
jgi:Leucine-rich repeat (LRR) protein